MSEQTTTRGRGAKRAYPVGRLVTRKGRRELHVDVPPVDDSDVTAEGLTVTMALADLERALQDAFDSGRDAEARVRGWQGWGG